MQIDEKKLARQEVGIDRWFDNDCNGILGWHTGVGKTFGTSLAIKRIEKFFRDTYFIIVPSVPLEKQWKDKLAEFFPKHLQERIIVKTLHTVLQENLQYEVGTLIIDEVHEFVTEDRLKLVNGTIIKHTRFLGLTASSDDKNFWKILKYYKVVDLIDSEEAHREGYVAKFIEYNVGLLLTDVEKEVYDNLTATISRNMPKFENNLDYANKVLQGGKSANGVWYSGAGWAMGMAIKKGWKTNLNLELESNRLINDLWNPSNFIGYARALVNAIRARRTLLCTATAKYNTTLKIAKKFDKVKTIIFSESTEFADKIGIILNNGNCPTVVYHSSLKTIVSTSPKTGKFIKLGKTRLKKEALEKIRTGKARILSTAKSLDRGLDITDLRLSIVASGTQNPTQNKQRTGRSTRKEEDSMFSDVPVLLINLYIVDTQDEIWLQKRQVNNKHQSIMVNSIEDISYIPPSNIEFTLNDL